MFVLFIILLCGFGLYALLQPPAEELYEESETVEFYPELKVSSVRLPESTQAQVHMSGKGE